MDFQKDIIDLPLCMCLPVSFSTQVVLFWIKNLLEIFITLNTEKKCGGLVTIMEILLGM